VYFLVNGVWLQVTVEDYKKALPGGQLTDELCKILFKSIEAPFNIMGTPVFQDYYVTHSWGETSTMSFLPHTESSKKVPSSGHTPKEQLLSIKMASTNDPDAELNAFLIAVGIGLLVIAGVVYEGIDLYFTKKSIELIVFIAICVGALVVGFVVYVIVYWVVLDALLPGDVVYETLPADQAAA